MYYETFVLKSWNEFQQMFSIFFNKKTQKVGTNKNVPNKNFKKYTN